MKNDKVEDIEMGKMGPDQNSNRDLEALNYSRDESDDEINTSRKLLDNNLQAERIMAKGMINRANNEDKPAQFVVEEKANGSISTLPPRSAEMNQKLYLQKYGINIDLPSMYVLDAQVNNKFPDHMFELVKTVLPEQENYIVQTSYMDGTTSKSSFREIEHKYTQGLVLRLIKRERSQLMLLKEIVLDGVWSAYMKFSECGTHFALIIPYHANNKVNEQIRFMKMESDDIMDFVHQLTNHKYVTHYPSLTNTQSFVDPKDIKKSAKPNVDPLTKSISVFVMKNYEANLKNHISFIKKSCFDQSLRFFVGYGKFEIFLLNLETNKSKKYSINKNLYEEIYDLNFCSSSLEDFKCYVACKRKVINQIIVYDYFEYYNKLKENQESGELLSAAEIDEQLTSKMSLNFGYQPTPQIIVKISRDFKTVVFTDEKEKFQLEQKNGYTLQRKLNQLEGKIIHHIKEGPIEEPGFYFIMCQEYDKSLKISHTNRAKKIFKIPRNVEPDIIKIFDFNVQIEQSQGNKGFTKKSFRMVSMKDDEFVCDYVIQDEKCEVVEENNQTKKKPAVIQNFEYKDNATFSYKFSSTRAFSTSWPYVACSGFANYLLLFNVFDNRFIQRIQLAAKGQLIDICDTYITDTYDLFVLVQSQGTYKLYMVDLDAANINENDGDLEEAETYKIGEPIFSYHDDDVDNRQFISILARGSSRKEVYDRNEKLFVYFLHQGFIYVWIQLNQNSRFDKIKEVSPTSSTQLYPIKDGQFLFLLDRYEKKSKKMLVEQKVMKLQTNFSMYQLIQYVKRNSDVKDRIESISMDHTTNLIMMLTQTKQLTAENNETIYKLKFFSIQKAQTIFEVQLLFMPFVGRLKSSLYQLIHGHVYYNNDMIKIRYDLINSPKNYKYKESELFDYYFGIFKFDRQSTRIRSNTPLDSIRYHKFVYVTQDSQCNTPRQIICLPYLHERRIYLNRIKDNTDYFYTSIESSQAEVDKFQENLQKQIGEITPKIGDQLVPEKKQEPPGEEQTNSSIICMNLREHKYYIYGTNGILQNRINYEQLYEEYGTPISTSSNGQAFIFKKSYDDIEKLSNLTNEQMVEQYMTIYILKISIFKFEVKKKINIIKNIREYLLQNSGQNTREEIEWINTSEFQNLKNEIDFQFIVNDKMDVCIKIFKKDQREYDSNGQRLERHQIEKRIPNHQQTETTIYYYENWIYNTVQKKEMNDQKQGVLQSVYITKEHGGVDFIINRLYIFFWNDLEIKFCPLAAGIEDKNFVKVNFRQQNLEKTSYINDVRTGSDPNLFIFVVVQGGGVNSIFTWIPADNAEAEAYDVGNDYEILWDKLGNLYILTDNKVILNKQRCCVKTFDFKDRMLESNKSTNPLNNKRGHRFDYKNHNWLMFKGQYISLPFCYMTFVIKDKIEKKDKYQKGNVFDPEPYNYLFNMGTSFTDGNFVRNDHKQLERVLFNFSQIDPDLLELMVYNQTMVKKCKETGKMVEVGFNTALYMAVKEGNNRSVDIILNYTSMINTNSSRNIMPVFGQLVNYNKFIKYLIDLPVQTAIMQQKQVLRVTDTFNDKIVKICESACINIDDQFYIDMMDEQDVSSSNYKSFPVKVVALRVAWIVNKSEGKEFLQSIYMNENLEYYKIPSVYMIVEFMYGKYKNILLRQLLPAFVLQAFFFQAMVYVFQGYYKQFRLNITEHDDQLWIAGNEDSKKFKVAAWLLLVLNSGMMIILIYFQYLLLLNMGFDYFKRFYSIVEVVYIVLVVLITMFCVTQLIGDMTEQSYDTFEKYTKIERCLEAISVFIIYVKAGYFLSLIDSIAPLMDNIAQVFWDIRYFIFVLVLQLIAFASCFYLLGQNQLQFDNISEEELATVGVKYDTFIHSIWYVYYNYILGTKNYSSFDLGDATQTPLLYILFIWASTYMLMILLRMLIAIMGNTFTTRNKVAKMVKVKDHLRFVMDNWHLRDYALNDKSQIQYIVCALSADELQSEKEKFAELNHEIKQIDVQNQDNFNKLQDKINQNTMIVQSLRKEQDDNAKRKLIQIQENKNAAKQQ